MKRDIKRQLTRLGLAVLVGTPTVYAADCLTTFDASCLSDGSVQNLAGETVSDQAAAGLEREVSGEEQGAFDEFASNIDTQQQRLAEEAKSLEAEFGPAEVAGVHKQRLKAQDARRMVQQGQHEELLGALNNNIEKRDDFIRSMGLD